MIWLGWLLATASVAEGGTTDPGAATLWGTSGTPATGAVAPSHQPPRTQRVSPPVQAEADPVIVPRRLQDAMDRQADGAQTPGQGPEQDELQRLLGDPSEATASRAALPGGGALGAWWWMLPVMGLLAGANLWLRRKGGLGKLAGGDTPLKIVARQSLGGTNQLVLLEVADPSGQTRRLLVGTGGDGPRLVSELHPQTDFEALIAEAPAEPVEVAPVVAPGPAVILAARASEALARETVPPRPSTQARQTVVPESRPKLAPPPSDPATYASRRYRQINRSSAPTATRPALAPDQRQQARSLVDEVLASRKERGWSA